MNINVLGNINIFNNMLVIFCQENILTCPTNNIHSILNVQFNHCGNPGN